MTFGNFALDFGVRGRRGNGGGGASSVTFVGEVTGSWASSDPYTFDLTTLTGGTDTSPSDGDCIVLLCNNSPNLLGGPFLPLPSSLEIAAQISYNDYNTARGQIAYMFASSTTELTISAASNGPVAAVVKVFRGIDPDFPLLFNTPTTGGAHEPANPPAIAHTPGTSGVSVYMGSISALAGSGTELILDPGNLDHFVAEPSVASEGVVIGAGYKIGQTGELTVDFGADNGTNNDWPAIAMGVTFAADQGLVETPLSITNPGAETGDLTGWVDGVGGWRVLTSMDGGKTPYAGTYSFVGPTSTAASSMYQDVDVSAHSTGIDAGGVFASVSWQQASYNGGSDNGGMWIQFLDVSNSVIGSHFESEPLISPGDWLSRTTGLGSVPTGTRTLRIYMEGDRTAGSHIQAYFDEIAASLWVAS